MPSRLPARIFLLSALLTLPRSLFGQDAIPVEPTAALQTVAERETQATTAALTFSSPPSAPTTPFQVGQVVFRPRFTYRYLNAEDVPVGARRVATEIQTFSPGLLIDLGRQWSFDYAPTWTYYTARAFRDTQDGSASLRGAMAGENWALQLSQSFSVASPTLIETAQQTKTRSWLGSIGASRNVGRRMSLQLGGNLAEEYTDLFPDTRNWSTQNWLTMALSSSLEFGIGPGAGYVEILGAPDMTFERYMTRVNWKATDTLTLSLNGGMEYRRSNASNGRELKYPTADASVTYQPFVTTTLRLGYSRALNSSFFQSQVTKNSSWTASVQQRLLERFYLSANWSHQESVYEGMTFEIFPPIETPPEGAETEMPPSETQPLLISLPGRTDEVDQFVARLTFQFLKRMSFSTTYQRSKNRSSQVGFSFNSTQYGFEIGFQY